MNDIQVFYHHNCPHISRLLTGFQILHLESEYNVILCDDCSGKNIPNEFVVEAVIDEIRIAFDLGDSWSLSTAAGRQYLNEVDAFFARGYINYANTDCPYLNSDDLSKVFPFGFDYYATYPGNPLYTPAKSLKGRIINTVKDLSGYNRCMNYDYIEQEANRKECNLEILFYTRLWDTKDIILDDSIPREIYDYRLKMIDDWKRINESRIEIIRTLSKEFGGIFSGGIQNCELAEKMCPDLILPASAVRKKSYLDKMKSSDICIGSIGLHKSTGWKTGEYVAAARAIVAEKLYYDVPGNFDDGKHYIPFSTTEECVSAVQKLYNNPDLVYEMKKANEDYYRRYLKPDVQIQNAINMVIDIHSESTT